VAIGSVYRWRVQPVRAAAAGGHQLERRGRVCAHCAPAAAGWVLHAPTPAGCARGRDLRGCRHEQPRLHHHTALRRLVRRRLVSTTPPRYRCHLGCILLKTPALIISLWLNRGAEHHMTTGASSIYHASRTGFRVYIKREHCHSCTSNQQMHSVSQPSACSSKCNR